VFVYSLLHSQAVTTRPPPPAPRRTQEARSEETQRRLLQATQALLLERGYTRLTTPDIARRAGVSRGALTHHFSSKEDIVVRALAAQLEETTSGLRRFCEARAVQGMSTDEVVDYLWPMMMDEGLFYVTLEYLPEARHNPGFRAQLLPVVQDFHAALDTIWSRLSERYGVPAERIRVTMNATMCLIRGMIAQTVLREDPAYFRQILDYWKAHLRESLDAPARVRAA
jgi:AcrR family transcriptional regulator